jgi:hypothetical protein
MASRSVLITRLSAQTAALRHALSASPPVRSLPIPRLLGDTCGTLLQEYLMCGRRWSRSRHGRNGLETSSSPPPRPQCAIVSLRSWVWLLAIDSSRQRRKQLQNATGELIRCGQARSSEYGEDRQPLDHRHRLGGVPPASLRHCHAPFPSTSSHLNSSKPLLKHSD